MTAEQFKWVMRAAAIGWLRYEQGCYLVAWERSPFWMPCVPDLIGINRKRHAIEIEFKFSVGDFKANARKRSMQMREASGRGIPWKFYFAVPPELVPRVRPILPEGNGLMTIGGEDKFGPAVHIVSVASCRKDASVVSANELGRMARHQSGSLHRATLRVARLLASVGARPPRFTQEASETERRRPGSTGNEP